MTDVCLLCWASVCSKGTAEKQAGSGWTVIVP